MKILVLQPHFDDAVWSIAEHMLTWMGDGHSVLVVTVFGAVSNDKEVKLHAEHLDVMSEMGIKTRSMPFLDDAHDNRGEIGPSVRSAVRDLLTEDEPNVVVMPWGIHHPDHLLLASCSVKGSWWYEELPYYVLYPDQAAPVRNLHEMGYGQAGHRDFLRTKKDLCRLYQSQWAPHLERTVFAPERLWQPMG